MSTRSPTHPPPRRPRTLAEKVWDDHLVVKGEDGAPDLIYIDLHLVHEVTSPQAFDGLRAEPPRAPPRSHDRDRRPQHPDARHRQADRRPHQPHPDRDPAPQRRGVRRAPALARRRRAGHRARRRPAARPHHAGHHRRLRRLAHLAPTARSAPWRSASARARSSTCSPPRRCRSSPSRPWRSPSRASCSPASPRRTSSSPSSRRSAPAAARATCSSTAAAPSAPSRWRAA